MDGLQHGSLQRLESRMDKVSTDVEMDSVGMDVDRMDAAWK